MTTSERPNVVLIHWHDVGTHLGAYGHGDVTSPAVDRLAAEGLRFDQAFCTTPLCSPARGSLFTGRYPHTNGLMGLVNRGWEYRPGERTAPSLLSELGYRTALIGQQHESRDSYRLGFDEVHPWLDGPARCGPVSEKAVEWLDAAPAEPFFLTVGFFETHRPYPVEEYPPVDPATVEVPPYLPDNHHTRADLAAFLGSIRVADAATGRVLDAIDRAGLAESTLVLFTTDHGIAYPRAKGTLYDPGIRVAFLARPPRSWNVAPGAPDGLLSHLDVLPTLLELAGGEVPRFVQGKSFAAVLRGEPGPRRREVFAEKNYHDEYDPIRSIRTDWFAYIRNLEPGTPPRLSGDIERSPMRPGLGEDRLRPRPAEELYDLDHDPWQRRDLAQDPSYTQVKADLAARLEAWMFETNDPVLAGVVVPPSGSLDEGPGAP
ncbi:sulfatase [Jiangella sp. DSM 45060]|uniref:sulfatase family protein n=1 Tax=Jiangella sp. DSM 45060 TaxID=1798224 RepID=UPI00087C2543|nr:sulfatase [Jiangella sp. DSM 45060]SDT47302.1 Arylsulfatase A [Jiangella sp. DSM 45060]